MRSCLVFLVLAACELTPAPKQAPPPPTPPTPAVAPVPVAVAADAGVALPDAMTVTDACLAVGSRVAELLIAEADLSERNALEQQRTTTVRRLAEACTTQSWGDDLRNCVLAAKKKTDLQACEKKFRPQPVQQPVPGNPDAVEKTPQTRTPPSKAGDPKAAKGAKLGEPKAAKPGEPKAPKATTPKLPKAGTGSAAPKQP